MQYQYAHFLYQYAHLQSFLYKFFNTRGVMDRDRDDIEKIFRSTLFIPL